MTLEASLTAVLKQSCLRVYPDFAPPGAQRPYVTYQQIYGAALTFVGREVPSKENAVMQIEVWSDTRKEAKALILDIEARLVQATQFRAKPEAAAVSDSDSDIPAYGSRQDFNIWADR